MSLIRAFPRLHLSLFDLGGVTYRKYGGAGFAISGPAILIEATRGDEQVFHGTELIDSDTRGALVQALRRLDRTVRSVPVRLRMLEVPRQHVGLGTTTALILAALKAADHAYMLRLDDRALQSLSGRGGTSGVGVNSFFKGGFIVDAGHEYDATMRFCPSDRTLPIKIPPVITHLPIPVDWVFHLIMPRGRRIYGVPEVTFFRNSTPIPREEVLEAMACVQHGVSPAVARDDLLLLKKALSRLRDVGFKAREVQHQPQTVRDVIDLLDENTDAAVGLSSMGPLVYVIQRAGDPVTEEVLHAACARHGAAVLGHYYGRNEGFEALE